MCAERELGLNGCAGGTGWLPYLERVTLDAPNLVVISYVVCLVLLIEGGFCLSKVFRFFSGFELNGYRSMAYTAP